jgi:LPS-assembly protein
MTGSVRARFLFLRRGPRAGVRALVIPAVLFALAALPMTPASAQLLKFPERSKPAKTESVLSQKGGDKQMLVQATEIHYDYAQNRVSAVGNVQIYFTGATLEADRVIYDQKTKRLRAEGNVRLSEANGQITYGEVMDLSDDYRDGFVDSLRLDAPEQTRFAAQRADRSSGNFTVFQSGVYTACEACRDDPKKPPLWQVKAARIIHDQGEKMLYFESAQLEFFGMPLAYFPYFSAPDPTVKRKTGLLMPVFSSSSKYGVGVETPYFWALAPNYDFTFSPRITSSQGPLVQGEWRHRLINGAYSIRAAGIYQLDPDLFVHDNGTPTPGNTLWRGSIESSGQFALNDKWVWGWDAVLLSDPAFFQDYGLSKYSRQYDPFKTGLVTEGVSQLYTIGKGDRSYFDARTIYYYGFSESDVQRQIPIIHPVIDYNYTFAQPIIGGELSYNVNATSLSRSLAEFDPITQNALNTGACAATSADPAVLRNRTNCLLRGIAGDTTRLSAEMNWRRTITDSFGQMFTPFMRLRGDVAAVRVDSEPGTSNFIQPGDSTLVRAMPTVGVEYRYPFIGAQSWGTQTIEPIAQLIARPNETKIGALPNEDAQSLIFDDGNLFRLDKFSGYDRVEGGGRANVGVQYTVQFNQAGSVNVLVGQSYQLFGLNSFAVPDTINTGLESGLDQSRSDYVARFTYQPDRIYTFTSRARFDEESLAVRRFELETRANYGRWTMQLLYGNYDAQPEIGFLDRRQGTLGAASVKVTANWVLQGSALYDIDAHKFAQTSLGAGYIDDCFILAVNYITNYTYSNNPKADQRLMLQLSLRTLGGTAVSQTVGTPTGSAHNGVGLGGL